MTKTKWGEKNRKNPQNGEIIGLVCGSLKSFVILYKGENWSGRPRKGGSLFSFVNFLNIGVLHV
jgi:hypothetical protein